MNDHSISCNFAGTIHLDDATTGQELADFEFEQDQAADDPNTITFAVYRHHREVLMFTDTRDAFQRQGQDVPGICGEQIFFLELIGQTMHALALTAEVQIDAKPEGAQVITITDTQKLGYFDTLCA